MGKQQLIAVGCGTCGDVRSTKRVPDACFRCGARYYARAPIGFLRFDLGEQASERGTLRIRPMLEAEFVGEWPAEIRARVEKRFFDPCGTEGQSREHATREGEE